MYSCTLSIYPIKPYINQLFTPHTNVSEHILSHKNGVHTHRTLHTCASTSLCHIGCGGAVIEFAGPCVSDCPPVQTRSHTDTHTHSPSAAFIANDRSAEKSACIHHRIIHNSIVSQCPAWPDVTSRLVCVPKTPHTYSLFCVCLYLPLADREL